MVSAHLSVVTHSPADTPTQGHTGGFVALGVLSSVGLAVGVLSSVGFAVVAVGVLSSVGFAVVAVAVGVLLSVGFAVGVLSSVDLSCGRLLSTATLAKACTCRKHYTTIHTFFCLACNAAARLPLAAVRTTHGIIWNVPLTEHAKFCLWGNHDRSCFFGLV